MALTDQQLVHRARRGELAAFEELVGRHERPIYTLARRMLRHEQDAEDVTQQTVLSALEHLDEFRGEAEFGTWLRRIAAHAALKVIRQRRTRPVVAAGRTTDADDSDAGTPHPEFIADWRASPAQLAQQQETGRLIEEALARLDEKHRLVFLLRDVEGYSVKETGDALGISEANVKVRLLRARLQLREQLTLAFGDPTRRLTAPGHS